MYFIAPRLPLPRCCAVSQCLQWLNKHAIWRGNDYSSWSLPTPSARRRIGGLVPQFPCTSGARATPGVPLHPVTMHLPQSDAYRQGCPASATLCVCVGQRLRWYLLLSCHPSCTCENEIHPPQDLRAKHQQGSLGMKGLLRHAVSFSSPPRSVIHEQGTGCFACDSSRMIPNIPMSCFAYHCVCPALIAHWPDKVFWVPSDPQCSC